MSTPASKTELLAVNTVRGLAIDAVQKANSGHPGLPLGAAAMAHTVFARHLRFNPKNPDWLNRDRFVLSAGHGSALLYAMLHVTGYDLPLDELKSFRQWGSKTPGHPENGLTPGVEMATGPLGQGISTAVGMAIAERYLSATCGGIVDHHTYVLASDGDLMEGIAQEACSLAGHLGLGKLIVLYDDNSITIDGSTDLAFTDDTAAKFRSVGWHVLEADGHSIEEVDDRLVEAKAETGRPTLIICKTTIGFGSPNKAGTSGSHGAPLGEDEVKLTKAALGLPVDEQFVVPSDVYAFYADAAAAGAEAEADWNESLTQLECTDAKAAAMLKGERGDSWLAALPSSDEKMATRKAGNAVLNAIAPHLPLMIGGSADLAASNLTNVTDAETFQKETPGGRNICFGIREHAMAAIVNGITLHGPTRGYGSTFLVFADYCRPSLRLAALMHCPSIFVFTHDSIGVGEDGPTHQPVEHAVSMRCIPNFNVMRPADANETAACWKIAVESESTPSALLLTRQGVPAITPPEISCHPAEQGGYVLAEAEGGSPDLVLVATGSEVGLAMQAREQLQGAGTKVRVVSLPSCFLFDQQPEAYRQSVLPNGVPTVSIEAGSTFGWERYADAHVGLDCFGASAPGGVAMEKFGFTVENIVTVAKNLI